MRRWLPLLLLLLAGSAWAASYLTHASTLSATLSMESGIPGWFAADITVSTECDSWTYAFSDGGATGQASGAALHVEAAILYETTGAKTPSVTIRCGTSFPYIASTAISVGLDTFDGFTVVDDIPAGEIKTAIENAAIPGVYIKPGVYTIDNPITINRASDLMVYGANFGTWLKSANENLPLFHVTGCTNVRFARFQASTSVEGWTDEVQIHQDAAASCDIETSQLNLRTIVMDGPGRLTAEATRWRDGYGQAAIVADDPDAEVVVLAGDISDNSVGGATSVAHIWIKRGWLSIWGTSIQSQPGTATIRLDDSGASDLPHYVVGIRNEGAQVGQPENRFLQVSGDARVAAIGNSMSWGKAGDTPSLANAVGTSTLYLIGNNAHNLEGAHTLVDGTLAGVTVVGIGNTILLNETIPAALATYRAHNLWWNVTQGDPITGDTSDVAGFPLPDQVSAPHALVHPKVTAASAAAMGWTTVVAPGDGVTDATPAIQAALDSGCVDPVNPTNLAPQLYFPAPAVAYKLTAPLIFDTPTADCFGLYADTTSLMLAGENAATTILQTTDAGEGILEVGGTRGQVIQDLTFDLQDVAVYDDSPTFAGIAMDSMPGGSTVQYGGLLHRVDISGGDAALVMGHTEFSVGNADTTIGTFSTFRDAAVAWASDASNSIHCYPVDSTLKDSAVAVAHGHHFNTGFDSASKGPLGFHVVLDGITDSVTTEKTNINLAYVMSDWTAIGDSPPRLYPGVPNSGRTGVQVILHDSTLAVPASVDPWYYRHWQSGGLILLDSTITGGLGTGVVYFPNYTGMRFFTALRSVFAQYAAIHLGPVSAKSGVTP